MLSFIINFCLIWQLDEHMIRTDFGRTILLWIKKFRYSLFPFIFVLNKTNETRIILVKRRLACSKKYNDLIILIG